MKTIYTTYGITPYRIDLDDQKEELIEKAERELERRVGEREL